MPNGSPDPRTGDPSAQDAGVIPANVEHFEVMQVQVAVQGLDEKLSRSS